MLTRLVIRDFVLIDAMSLDLAAGLNVFTGETGAGKSILLDAMGLALGGRGDAAAVKVGAEQATITAEFTSPFPPAVQDLATENGLTLDDPLILRRTVGRDGRSRAFVNDQPVGIGLLRRFGELLVEIHSQFETQGLLNPANHRGMVDAFAGAAELVAATATAFSDWQALAADCLEAATATAHAAAEADFLRSAVAELNDLDPIDGEGDRLAARRTLLLDASRITEAIQNAAENLDGDRGAAASLAKAGKSIARVADKTAGLTTLLATLDQIAADVEEAGHELSRLLADIGGDGENLAKIEERLFTLRSIARKHGVLPDELPRLRVDLAQRLDLLLGDNDRASILAKRAAEARHHYVNLADKLRAKRTEAGARLSAAVLRELKPLKLERAQFAVDIALLPQEQWSASGSERVTFLATANPGSPLGALHKAASGGELARFMLALKVVAAASNPVPVMVFDEVDSGIGGATASAVGERLARLASEGIQVLVVTHSPQVAARGTSHLRVIKHTRTKNAATAVDILSPSERIEEIARMLSANTVTDAARHAARSLLEEGISATKND